MLTVEHINLLAKCYNRSRGPYSNVSVWLIQKVQHTPYAGVSPLRIYQAHKCCQLLPSLLSQTDVLLWCLVLDIFRTGCPVPDI